MSLDVTLTIPLMVPKEEARNFPPHVVYETNVTHNLNRMAEAAGVYQACWRPEELGITKAGQLVQLLRAGIEKMRADPAYYRTFDAENGWGRYDDFLPWLERYLEACERCPFADLEVSR